jgi:hypothetical protein
MKKLILILIVPMIGVFFGCGDKNEVSGEKKNDGKQEMKSERKNETSEKKSEEINKNEQTSDAESDPSKSDLNKSNELGMTPGMPPNYPNDIPQPKNAKTLGSLNSSEGTVVTFESPDKVQDIVNYYKEEMKKNGYEMSEGGETLVSDKGGLISWKKDNREVGLMLGYDKDKNITSLVITYK